MKDRKDEILKDEILESWEMYASGVRERLEDTLLTDDQIAMVMEIAYESYLMGRVDEVSRTNKIIFKLVEESKR